MFFYPTIVCYMSAQEAYQKYLDMLTTATNIAVAAISMSVVTPVLLNPKS